MKNYNSWKKERKRVFSVVLFGQIVDMDETFLTKTLTHLILIWYSQPHFGIKNVTYTDRTKIKYNQKGVRKKTAKRIQKNEWVKMKNG